MCKVRVVNCSVFQKTKMLRLRLIATLVCQSRVANRRTRIETTSDCSFKQNFEMVIPKNSKFENPGIFGIRVDFLRDFSNFLTLHVEDIR